MSQPISPITGNSRLTAVLTASLALVLCPSACLAESFSAPSVPVHVPDRVVVPLLPTDVTNMGLFVGSPLGPVNMPKLDPSAAVKRLSESSFPSADQARDEGSGIIIKTKKGCDFERISTLCIQLTSGSVFVSVRKPANLAIITTPHGTISVANDGDAIVTFRDGLLTVMNLSAFGERVKVRIHQAAVSASVNGKTYGEAKTEGIVVAVKYGHELMASDTALSRLDLRPSDGIARRRSALFENDCMAVTEFSLTSALTNTDLLSSFSLNNSDPKEHRVLADLAKMAAVLDYVNGQGGYVARGKQKQQ